MFVMGESGRVHGGGLSDEAPYADKMHFVLVVCWMMNGGKW